MYKYIYIYIYACIYVCIYRAGFKKRKVIRHFLVVASESRHTLAK